MRTRPTIVRQQSRAYELFILVLTILALVVMVGILLPLDPAVTQLLIVYDNLICVVFLFDFVIRLRAAPSKGGYFFREFGWLDLLGSIPTFGFFKYSSLLRLARINRLLRASRLLDPSHRRELIRDVIQNRGQYAAFITILSAFMVLVVSSALVLGAESHAPGANITTGGDALWWAVVTITTVGYGDEYPVTSIGRLTAVFVMFAGVGIIGSLASILSSVLVPPAPADAGDAGDGDAGNVEGSVAATANASAGDAPPAVGRPAVPAAGIADAGSIDVSALQAELTAIRAELVAIRTSLAPGAARGGGGGAGGAGGG